MAASQDTEITLGTGKMLAVFFGLVLLCAVFFGMGFSLGRSSVKPLAGADLAATQAANAGVRPSAVKPVSSATPNDLTFYKTVQDKDADAQPAANNAAADTAATEPAPSPAASDGSTAAPPDAMMAPPTNGYFVQVAAVSKQEDAEALVAALKKKQYPAFASNTSTSDKLFHVQVGPFSDIKDAESMRAKLVNDGYNPILKK
ncbi:MAG TPA: SPOR domain-containing protein [Terriglobales bacterium]|jgi:cell division septation protein DedD|nr:SPOR domain-containing protein [Terriglobales bacterium]